MAEENGWAEWGKHVLKELERLHECDAEQWKMINELRIENSMLKVKAGIFGAICGSIPALIAVIAWLMKKSA